MRRCVCPQPSDADVVAGPAEDGGGEQEGPDGHELHQVTQQSGRPADCVSVLRPSHSYIIINLKFK